MAVLVSASSRAYFGVTGLARMQTSPGRNGDAQSNAFPSAVRGRSRLLRSPTGESNELIFVGGPPPLNPTQWQCLGNPYVGTPVSRWMNFGMGISWPNQANHMPFAWVACQYTYYPEDRRVSWHTFYKVDGVWYPYPVDRCFFWCAGNEA